MALASLESCRVVKILSGWFKTDDGYDLRYFSKLAWHWALRVQEFMG